VLKMLTAHALVCDATGCGAYFIPSGHQDITARTDQTLLNDPAQTFKEAQAAGWRTNIPARTVTGIDKPALRDCVELCRSCAADRQPAAARPPATQRPIEQLPFDDFEDAS
jgi:hypothetical protein